ncbi:hypothetical protein SAMN04488020_102296 [Palleronia marisminoris]|uniref:Lipoprotein n=1 Tax=Palleronia marisminoris TaxID=315423 RepID=A0A1Y5RYC9_9RHOB|nr:hypothetical protein [Palleronia marisminoris]SFG46103.1 hypothetical protein SAMN04488020_102296 [Palleronia marisminoris]SLN25774.1 hypothetical protein PAM7066_00985 [Palleronia marisminoris]
MTRNLILLGLSTLSIGCLLAMRPALGATPDCAPRPDLIELLTKRDGESWRFSGTAQNGSVVETFAADNGSWTVLITRPDGISCLLASGAAFETNANHAGPA